MPAWVWSCAKNLLKVIQIGTKPVGSRSCARPNGCEQRPAVGTRFRSRPSLTEHKAAQLVAQLLHFFGIRCGTKTFGQREESLLFLLASFDSLLDKFYQKAIVAETQLSVPRRWSLEYCRSSDLPYRPSHA
jgi:hypothetical protein